MAAPASNHHSATKENRPCNHVNKTHKLPLVFPVPTGPQTQGRSTTSTTTSSSSFQYQVAPKHLPGKRKRETSTGKTTSKKALRRMNNSNESVEAQIVGDEDPRSPPLRSVRESRSAARRPEMPQDRRLRMSNNDSALPRRPRYYNEDIPMWLRSNPGDIADGDDRDSQQVLSNLDRAERSKKVVDKSKDSMRHLSGQPNANSADNVSITAMDVDSDPQRVTTSKRTTEVAKGDHDEHLLGPHHSSAVFEVVLEQVDDPMDLDG